MIGGEKSSADVAFWKSVSCCLFSWKSANLHDFLSELCYTAFAAGSEEEDGYDKDAFKVPEKHQLQAVP